MERSKYKEIIKSLQESYDNIQRLSSTYCKNDYKEPHFDFQAEKDIYDHWLYTIECQLEQSTMLIEENKDAIIKDYLERQKSGLPNDANFTHLIKELNGISCDCSIFCKIPYNQQYAFDSLCEVCEELEKKINPPKGILNDNREIINNSMDYNKARVDAFKKRLTNSQAYKDALTDGIFIDSFTFNGNIQNLVSWLMNEKMVNNDGGHSDFDEMDKVFSCTKAKNNPITKMQLIQAKNRN